MREKALEHEIVDRAKGGAVRGGEGGVVAEIFRSTFGMIEEHGTGLLLWEVEVRKSSPEVGTVIKNTSMGSSSGLRRTLPHADGGFQSQTFWSKRSRGRG